MLKYFFEKILKSLENVIIYQEQLQFNINKVLNLDTFISSNHRARKTILSVDVFRVILNFIKREPELWYKYNEGAKILSCGIYFEEIQKTLGEITKKEARPAGFFSSQPAPGAPTFPSQKWIDEKLSTQIGNVINENTIKIENQEKHKTDYTSYFATLTRRICNLPIIIDKYIKKIRILDESLNESLNEDLYEDIFDIYGSDMSSPRTSTNSSQHAQHHNQINAAEIFRETIKVHAEGVNSSQKRKFCARCEYNEHLLAERCRVNEEAGSDGSSNESYICISDVVNKFVICEK